MGVLEAVVAVLVALIAAGIPAWLGLQRLRVENAAQHSHSAGLLEEIRTDVREVRRDLGEHISWHAHRDEEQP